MPVIPLGMVHTFIVCLYLPKLQLQVRQEGAFLVYVSLMYVRMMETAHMRRLPCQLVMLSDDT